VGVGGSVFFWFGFFCFCVVVCVFFLLVWGIVVFWGFFSVLKFFPESPLVVRVSNSSLFGLLGRLEFLRGSGVGGP